MDDNSFSVGVGGWVVRHDGAVLLVRMTYGPAKGRLMIPGGHADHDEFVDDTAVREVREETGIEAVPHGVLMVRQRIEPAFRNLYFVLLMMPTGETQATPDGTEVSEALWLTPDEILARDDIQPITRELATAYRAAPAACLAGRALTWQDASQYRLWAGPPSRPESAP